MTFETFDLHRSILAALAADDFKNPTPIQSRAIPPILEGRDVIGLAQTGTGKTAAFTLPVLHDLASFEPMDPVAEKPGGVRALVLSPTRELAAQIYEAARGFGKRLDLRMGCIVGGVSLGPQKRLFQKNVDLLVATPGRLIDLMDQNVVRLGAVETVVLDEADQMLDIGFLPAIKRILGKTASDRQTLLFSATMSPEIRKLTERYLSNPVEVSVAPQSTTAERIRQSVVHLAHEQKLSALAALIRAQTAESASARVIVFTRTKRGADRVAKRLSRDGIDAAAIHGDKSQGQRVRALDGFRAGTMPVLIATDIAARGIDVPGVELVINYELPDTPEAYVHRIGRTARAGADGVAVALCKPDEQPMLRAIERLIRQPIPAAPAPEGTDPAPVAEPGETRGRSDPSAAKSGGARSQERRASAQKPGRKPQSQKPQGRRGGEPKAGAAKTGAAKTSAAKTGAAKPGTAAGQDPAHKRSRRRRGGRNRGAGPGDAQGDGVARAANAAAFE